MLTNKNKKYLKSLANTCENKYQLGKNEITDNLIMTLDDALEAKELIKVTINNNASSSKEEIGENLAKKLDAELVQIIGHVIVLYRESKKHKKIYLK